MTSVSGVPYAPDFPPNSLMRLLKIKDTREEANIPLAAYVFVVAASMCRLIASRDGSGFGTSVPTMLPGECFVGI